MAFNDFTKLCEGKSRNPNNNMKVKMNSNGPLFKNLYSSVGEHVGNTEGLKNMERL